MNVIWLIAKNFVREQRLALYVLLVWVFSFGGLFTFWHGDDTESILLIFRQQAGYGILVTLFVSSTAVFNDQKSRRIVAVLSKGVFRAEYLAGLLLGSIIFSGIFVGCLGLVTEWFAFWFGFTAHIWPTLAGVALASSLAASIALMFSCLLPPFLATAATLSFLGLPAALAMVFRGAWENLFPVAYVIDQVIRFDYTHGWQGSWWFALVALLQTGIFMLLAIAIFRRRDVTLAIE